MYLAAIGDVILFGLFFVTSTGLTLVYKDIRLISIAWIIATSIATIFAFGVGRYIQPLTWELDTKNGFIYYVQPCHLFL